MKRCALCRKDERLPKKHLCRACGEMIARLLIIGERQKREAEWIAAAAARLEQATQEEQDRLKRLWSWNL